MVSKKLAKYKKEMEKQLDVSVILQRIIKLEESLIRILSKEEIKDIWKGIIYERAKELRQLLNEDFDLDVDERKENEEKIGKEAWLELLDEGLKHKDD